MSLVLLALLLAACAAPPAPAPTAAPAAPATTITFAASEARRDSFAPLIEAFNAQNPDLRVQFVPLAPGATLADAVRQADSVFGYPASEAEDASLVRDLAPFIDADSTFEPADLYPAANSATEQRLALPLALLVPLLDYNAELWAQQGLQPPDASWTWADLLAAAEQLTRAGEGVAGLYDEGGRLTLQAELAGAGVSLERGAALDQPAVVAAVARVRELAGRGVILTVLDGTGTTLAERIRASQLGLWPSELTTDAVRDGALLFATAHVPYPLLRDRLLARPLGAMMSAGTQQPDATWRWLSFLSRQQVQPASDGSAGAVAVPARRSVAVASGVWATLDPAASGAIQVLLEREVSANEWLDGDPAVLAAVEQALERVLTVDQAPELALAEVQATLPAGVAATTADPASFAVVTPGPAQPEGELTVIRFAPNNAFGNVWGDPIYAAFQEQHPEIVVEFVEPPEIGRYAVNYESVAASAADADCFAWRGPPAPNEVSAVVDLRTLIDAAPTFPLEDFWPQALQSFEREGRLTGLPYSVGIPTLWYNQDLFDAAGLPYPTNDWTFAEVLGAAETLTTEGQYGLFDGGSTTLTFFLDHTDVNLFSGQGSMLQPRFTEPEVVETLERYVAFVKRVTPFAGKFSYSQPATSAEAVQLRQTGMLFYGNLMSWGAEEQLGARFGVVLLGDTQPASYWRSGAFYISASSPHIDACWKWISYLSQSDLGGVFNARRSLGQELLASPRTLPGADEAYGAYTQLLEQPRDPQSAANFIVEPIAPYWLFRALDRVFREDAGLAAELTEAQFVTEQYLVCVQSGERAEACAKQVDPTFAPWVFNL